MSEIKEALKRMSRGRTSENDLPTDLINDEGYFLTGKLDDDDDDEGIAKEVESVEIKVSDAFSHRKSSTAAVVPLDRKL